ncbi:MAG: hypothetical protein WC709_10270 [Thermoleophilia bacterium]
MNAQRLILRLIDGGRKDIDAFQAALDDRDLPAPGPASWVLDRAALLYTVFVGLQRAAARRPASPASRAVFYEVGAPKEPLRQIRSAFARTHFGDEVDFLHTHRLKGHGGPRRLTDRERRLARAWRRRARVAALATLLDRRRRYRWWGHVFATINTFAQAADQFDTVYVTKPWDRRSYAMATFLRRNTGAEVRLVYQSMPLYGNQRRLHVPVTAVVTSRVNVPEAEYFRAAGEFRATEIVYRSSEFVEERAALVAASPTYDIGFYASGDWAREDGLYWARDIEQVRAGAFSGNVYERHAEEVLAWLVEYAASRRRTLRIYPHPYERTLLHEHGIEPPYFGLADGELVTIDDRAGNSRSSHYEADVAVALRSSTIWQRIDLGLERSFMYAFSDPALGNVLPEALGEYQRNLFRSAEELHAKLDACFAAPGVAAAEASS